MLVVLAGGATLGAGERSITDRDIASKVRAGKFAEAEKLARERLAIVERESGAESVEAANVLDLLSESMRRGGKGGQAELGEICERAVRIKEVKLGKNGPGYAASLYQLGYWHYVNGEYDKAEPMLERSLKIREETLGGANPDVACGLLMVGVLRSEQGDHAAAKPYIERALSIRETLDPDGPGVAECLNALAGISVRSGDYATAEPMYRRAIRIWTGAWGAGHPKVGTGWNDLSTVLYATGDFAGALECKERALQIRTRTLGPQHELVGWTRANMGMNLAALGRKSGARKQYLTAIGIMEHRFGSDSPEVGWILKRLGDTYIEPGHYRQAVPILERAVANLRAGEGTDHPDVGEAMAALGAAKTAIGDTAEGNRLNREALTILRTRLGASHPEVGFTLTQHAGALAVAREPGAAVEEALEGEEVSREHLRLMCRTMPERAALAYAASRPSGGRLALSVLSSVPHPDSETLVRVWDSLVRSRTLVLDEMTTRMRAASQEHDPGAKRLIENLNAARRRLANLIVAGPGDMTASAYRKAVESARESNENAERALGAKSVAFNRDRERARVGFHEVRSALPPGSALVSYAAAGEGRDRSYVVFVLAGQQPQITFHRLGQATRVESIVSRWLSTVGGAAREASTSARDRSRAWGDSVEALLWRPIASSIGDTKRVFIVGDGAILFVNFSALPSGRSRYIVEDGPVIHYLTSERDLVRSRGDPTGIGLLALGDPAFNQGEAPSGIARMRGARGEASTGLSRDAWNCGDFQEVRFKSLSHTGIEVREVARIWGDPKHTTLLTGGAANERAFKAEASGHKVLHLATHGFFLDGPCEGSSPDARGIGATVPMSSGARPRTSTANPIQLSGLALAGANERAAAGPDDEDGILTAEEIAGLDLSGTDWAVLSACDTGKGQIQFGEGVLGLRRAFQSAGTRTVIMSLWEVEDESARKWMQALYENRVTRRLDTAEAVTQADLEVLRARRAQALSTNPFYWAAFVATGDWK